MSFNATPLGQGRRLDHSAFLGKNISQRPRELDPPRLLHPSASSHLPVPPSSDDDNQPALVRFARLKQREQANATAAFSTRPGGPRTINAPPNPEHWSVKDTSVNVATAFHQAATSSVPDIIDMQTLPTAPTTQPTANSSWTSGSNRSNSAVPRSTSVEYEKEAHSTGMRNRLAPPPSRLNNQGAGLRSNTSTSTSTSATATATATSATRRPLTKTTTSATLVPDSEAENEIDSNGRGKSPLNQVVDAAKRALAPATFYLRQRSQEPEGADKSTSSNPNGQNASYDYSAEEREFQASISHNAAKPNSTSQHTPGAHRKNRMSVDNKAYRPSPSDDEGSDGYSDDGKGRRRRKKKKKNEPLGGPLKTLPVMAADKRKRRKSKGKTGAAGEGEDDDDEASDSDDNLTEKASISRASVARSSIPPLSRRSVRGSVPPEHQQPSHLGDVSLDDAEQGLQSIPEVEDEDVVVDENTEAHARDGTPLPIPNPNHFSVGASLGRIVHVAIKSCINFLWLLVNLLAGLFLLFGRILETIMEIILFRPLRILGLVRSPLQSSSADEELPTKPIGKYLFIGLAILGTLYAIQGPGIFSVPTSIPITLPPLFTSKGRKQDRLFVAPGDFPANFAELGSRFQAMESVVSDLSKLVGDHEAGNGDLLSRLEELTERLTREARERKRIMDSLEGRVKDGVEGAVRRVEENVEKRLVEGERRVDRKVEDSVSSRVKEVEKKVVDGVVGGEIGTVKKEMQALRAKLATAGNKQGGNDEEARNRLHLLEERFGEIESEVKEALEWGKKAAAAPPTPQSVLSGTGTPWWTKFSPSKGSQSPSIAIKSTDGRDVVALIDQLVTSSVLTHLHKDVLAKADYALFSAGARVISSLTSPTLELSPTSLHRRFLAFVTGHGYAIGRPPVTALHHDVQNGFCWPFEGSQGQLGVMLAAPVKVESVTVDHVPKEVAMDVRSAPKDMEVWALVEGEQNVRKLREWREGKREAAREQGREEDQEEIPYPPSLPRQPEYIRLANFTYNLDGPSHIQNFPVEEVIQELGLDFGVVVLMVKSNWGQTGFTCLYRFRVHGTRLETPGLATSEDAETTAIESDQA